MLALEVSSDEAERDGFSFSGAGAGVAGMLGVMAGEDCACCTASTTGGARVAGKGCVIAGELVALARAPARDAGNPGGGGRGAMPTPFLSLAAAAAAAEAYFNGSPGVRVGSGAGFIDVAEELEAPGNGVCSVANTGNGDLSCVDGRRPLDCAVSDVLPLAIDGLDSMSIDSS